MNTIALNFVPLSEQDRKVTIYRKCVLDNSQPKDDKDFRGKLPREEGDEEWVQFDISVAPKDGYEDYEYKFSENHLVTVDLIYKMLCTQLDNKQVSYKPAEGIVPGTTLKKVIFEPSQEHKFEEGSIQFIVQPYYLEGKNSFGFLVNHKFELNKDQEFNKIVQIRSLSLDESGRSNIYFYKDKRNEIEDFVHKILSPSLSDSNLLEIQTEFLKLRAERLHTKTYLVGDKRAVASQFIGIKANGPYRRIDSKIRYLFLFSERTRSLAREIYSGLIGKLFPGQFSGLETMFSLPISKENVEHLQVETYNEKAIQDTDSRIKKLKSEYPRDKLMLIAVLPKGFKGTEARFNAYGHLKLMAFKNKICCQVITEDTFFKKDQLKWSISNIGLQIFSKLGGVPWLVRPAKQDCLVLGLGNVQEGVDANIKKYKAYTVCLNSSGEFKYIRPLASSNDEATYLENLRTELKKVLSEVSEEEYKSLVLHLPYKIKKKEIEIIKDVVAEIREKIEVVAIRINTGHKFLGFSKHNTCVPYESTYVKLSKNEFLIWAEGLQDGNKVLSKRVSEPLYINFIESQEDWETKKEYLQDILNLAGANWRGFNSKAQPISILYSRLIAKFMQEFSHLEDVDVSAESSTPWFL